MTPLEFQRWLDLKGQIGQNFAKSTQAGLSAMAETARRCGRRVCSANATGRFPQGSECGRGSDTLAP